MDRANREPMARLAQALRSLDTLFKRFRHWVKADVFKRIFDALSDDPDMEYAMVDAEPRHGQGKDFEQASGQVKGWDDDENLGSHRCVGQSGALRTAARPSLRLGTVVEPLIGSPVRD